MCESVPYLNCSNRVIASCKIKSYVIYSFHMKDKKINFENPPSGDHLLKILEALANPHRLRIVAILTKERNYISELARVLKMSRPLLYMHLQRLEKAELITSSLELSEDGKAMKYVAITPFALQLNPEQITEGVKTLTIKTIQSAGSEGKKKKEDDL
jgi:predicted transcriptional regulator